MDVITVILYTLVIIVALLLIGLVLIQQSKGGGFGGAFGGVGESVFGAHAGSHLTKLTVILTTSFFVLTLLLAVIVGHSSRERSVVEIGIKDSALATEAKVTEKKSDETTSSANKDKIKVKKPENVKSNTQK